MIKEIKLNLGLDKIKSFTVSEVLGKGNINAGEGLLKLLDGNIIIPYSSPIEGLNFYPLVKEGDVITNGQSIYTYEDAETNSITSYVDDKIWDLAIATNAVFKGLLGSMGQSGQIASSTVKIKTELEVKKGIEQLLEDIGNAMKEYNDLENGDVVVVAEKPYPVAQNRLVPVKYIYERDPKKMSAEERKKYVLEIGKLLPTPLDEEDLILADSYTEDPEIGQMCTMGAYNHNLLAYQTAEIIRAKTGKVVDVVISDTDTGIDVRKTIIGCITLGASPIGATKGLSLYECMRASCAAEFSRGSTERIPIIICKPAERCRKREGMGEFRGYDGKLKYSIEGKIAFD
ncbi:hypothetical protein ACSLMH_03350 [Flavobacterium columnare]|uniref:hypothetical protein n=1 Tax=Flavobacterium columnare TaxID=996 RepID=UPI00403493F4